MVLKVPITQSKMWQKLQDDLGETNFLEMHEDYQYLAILKSTPVGNYLYLPYGPVAKNKAAFNMAIKDLEMLAKKTQAIFIRIEPRDPSFVLPKNAKKTLNLSPEETWVLDLTGNESDLKSRLPSRLLRYYNAATKKGLLIEASHNPDDIHYLINLQKALADKKNINIFSENYLKTELSQPFSTLYLVKYQDDSGGESVVAAGLVFDDATTRYNLQGAQSELGRRLHATGILTIKLILDAKAKNLQVFDFWGIAPDDAPKNHPWSGFTAFKKTFAGTEVKYLGTFDLILSPIRYRFYQFFRKLHRML